MKSAKLWKVRENESLGQDDINLHEQFTNRVETLKSPARLHKLCIRCE